MNQETGQRLIMDRILPEGTERALAQKGQSERKKCQLALPLDQEYENRWKQGQAVKPSKTASNQGRGKTRRERKRPRSYD
ncbi:MAG: hypothetical protein ACUVV5_01960 [Candidatus Aminicenantales bacterium]